MKKDQNNTIKFTEDLSEKLKRMLESPTLYFCLFGIGKQDELLINKIPGETLAKDVPDIWAKHLKPGFRSFIHLEQKLYLKIPERDLKKLSLEFWEKLPVVKSFDQLSKLIKKGIEQTSVIAVSRFAEAQKFGVMPKNKQLSIFDIIDQESGRKNAQLAKELNISCTGLDLSVRHYKAFHALQTIFHDTRIKGNHHDLIPTLIPTNENEDKWQFTGDYLIAKVTPAQLCEAVPLKKRETKRGKFEYHPKERNELIQCIQELNTAFFYINYDVGDRRIRVVATVISVAESFKDLTEREKKALNQSYFSTKKKDTQAAAAHKKLECFYIKFSPIFLEENFVLKPRNILQRLQETGRLSKPLILFSDYLHEQASYNNFELKISREKLAYKLRLNNLIEQQPRRYKRLETMINDMSNRLKKVGLIKSYKLGAQGKTQKNDIFILNKDSFHQPDK